ncbi:hypothetical protein [Neorhodopirellula pilleata]|uniref:Secreted protein n=1 Tax=Neorhodopirellula pilleata TaxID=2714738 RepID=A0A5C6AE71_9BACT|nr:hypothetical protein [Neorhodopirellula pilleata]TWT97371.1 hypothetical protein Pla100_25230 [Neorhodopirellula pilleata]
MMKFTGGFSFIFFAFCLAIFSGCGGATDATVVGSEDAIANYLEENPEAATEDDENFVDDYPND